MNDFGLKRFASGMLMLLIFVLCLLPVCSAAAAGQEWYTADSGTQDFDGYRYSQISTYEYKAEPAKGTWVWELSGYFQNKPKLNSNLLKRWGNIDSYYTASIAENDTIHIETDFAGSLGTVAVTIIVYYDGNESMENERDLKSVYAEMDHGADKPLR